MLHTNVRFGEVVDLSSVVDFSSEKVNVTNVFENANGGVAVLAFKAGQELAKHLAPAEVMVNVVEGEIEFTMIDKIHRISAGQFLLMGEAVPHSVRALKDSKVVLVKLKSDK